jgi:hypothetical protein
MDELTWLSSESPQKMIDFLNQNPDERKLRLWCDSCRYTVDPSGSRWSQITTKGMVMEWGSGTWWIEKISLSLRADLVREHFGNPFRKPSKIWITPTVKDLAQAAYDHQLGVEFDPAKTTKSEVLRQRENAVMGGCCDRFADQMACDCYEEAIEDIQGTLDPVRLGILADAIEDEGCGDEDVIRHLRGYRRCPNCLGNGQRYVSKDNEKRGLPTNQSVGYYLMKTAKYPQSEWKRSFCTTCKREGWISFSHPHFRGCWVLDLILEKP